MWGHLGRLSQLSLVRYIPSCHVKDVPQAQLGHDRPGAGVSKLPVKMRWDSQLLEGL